MSMSAVPSSERLHIGFFGRTNAGKSSVINAVTNQKLSIVSDIKGTTTDPVIKTMEILPIGPVVIIDTPGTDDDTQLGKKRVEKSFEVLGRCDVAVVVVDSCIGITDEDNALVKKIKSMKTPYIICYNKKDVSGTEQSGDNVISVSAQTGENINELKELIAKKAGNFSNKKIIGDRLKKSACVVLVIPIDSAAPKNRIILPQQMVLREVLDANACAVCVQTGELGDVLGKVKADIVITDSQAFSAVSKIVPENIPLTSFSVLMMRYKGELDVTYKGASTLDVLSDNDKVLICEGCTHHRQCDDIGTVKLPKWIEKYTGKSLRFDFTSGGEFPKDLSEYKLIVHCGGCMLNEKEIKRRICIAEEQNVPITNYGIAIAKINGILDRAVSGANLIM